MDIVNEVYRRLNGSVEYNFYPMRRSVYMLEKGKANVFIGASKHLYNDTLKNDYLSIKLYPLTFVIYYIDSPGKSLSAKDFSALHELSVGSVRGSATESSLYDNGFKNIVWATSIENNLLMFLNKRFDLCVSEESTADAFFEFSKEYGVPKVEKISKPLLKMDMVVGFHKSMKEDAARFENELQKVKKDGSLDGLISLYFGEKGLRLYLSRTEK